MRRADRLFQIVQLIRGRRLSTAAFLAVLDEQTLEQILADKTGARRLLALADT